eukprot:5374888-Pleurochrysis_carterae.AAC.1
MTCVSNVKDDAVTCVAASKHSLLNAFKSTDADACFDSHSPRRARRSQLCEGCVYETLSGNRVTVRRDGVMLAGTVFVPFCADDSA